VTLALNGQNFGGILRGTPSDGKSKMSRYFGPFKLPKGQVTLKAVS